MVIFPLTCQELFVRLMISMREGSGGFFEAIKRIAGTSSNNEKIPVQPNQAME